MEMEGGIELGDVGPLFTPKELDAMPRYYCDYCGVCRPHPGVIETHIQRFHAELANKDEEKKANDTAKRLAGLSLSVQQPMD